MGRQVRARHMDWFHLPIPDVSVPDAAFEQQWAVISPDLMHRLRAGFDVLVHCKGGLGRAGTIAARLMIGMGVPAEQAVKAVRAVRPGAIETGAQLTHVLAQAAMPEPVPDTSAAAIRDRVLSDECEPVSVGCQTPEPMLNKVDATQLERRRGSA
jgi:ADP-ribosyl-[dinitrogen reductase] hydrolase